MLELLPALIQPLMEQYPLLVSIAAIMGSCRLIMKPLMSLLSVIVKQTPTPKDDALLAKVMEHKLYKGLVYILDLVASVKLPKK